MAREPNTAARPWRNPVGGRKNSDGSGSVGRAPLAARMLSVGQTVVRWGLKPPQGLRAFFQAWAANGGPGPTDRSAFLPGPRTPARREARARPAPGTLSPLTAQAQEGDAMAVVDTASDRFSPVACSPRSPPARWPQPGDRHPGRAQRWPARQGHIPS